MMSSSLSLLRVGALTIGSFAAVVKAPTRSSESELDILVED